MTALREEGRQMFEIFLEKEVEVSDDHLELVNEVITKGLEIEGITCEGEVSILIVDNAAIRLMNNEYRGKDTATDVLSFPQYEDPLSEKVDYLALGDIVISIERAKEQAEDFGHPLKREVAYLVAHSFYHLLGYDHMNEDDKKEMRIKEEVLLEILGIGR